MHGPWPVAVQRISECHSLPFPAHDRFSRFHESLALFAGHCFFIAPFYFERRSTGSHVRGTLDGRGRPDKSSSRMVTWTRQNMLASSETLPATLAPTPDTPRWNFTRIFSKTFSPARPVSLSIRLAPFSSGIFPFKRTRAGESGRRLYRR